MNKKGIDKLSKDLSFYNNMDVDKAHKLIIEAINPKNLVRDFLFMYESVLKWMNKKKE